MEALSSLRIDSIKPVKLNLGCGRNYREGYINVDIVRNVKVDVLADLNFNLPFRDCVAEETLLISVLEHVNDPCHLIEEVYRVCCAGGKVFVHVPHFTSATTYADMQHKKGFSIRVFDDYTGHTRWSFQFKPRFKIIEKKIIFPKGKLIWNRAVERLVNLSTFTQNVYENTFIRCLFPADSVYFKLEVIK